MESFRPTNKLEEISIKIIRTPDYNLESGHLELAEYYDKIGETGNAILEYEAVIASIPGEFTFYEKAATIAIREKHYDKADQLLRNSLQYKSDYFATKWIGQIALMNNDIEEAIKFLLKSDLVDQQVMLIYADRFTWTDNLIRQRLTMPNLKTWRRNRNTFRI